MSHTPFPFDPDSDAIQLPLGYRARIIEIEPVDPDEGEHGRYGDPDELEDDFDDDSYDDAG